MSEPLGGESDGRAALRRFHAAHGATFETEAGVEVVADYGRPDRTHRAVRNGVGVAEMPYDVIVLTGGDRHDYLDNLVTASVPTADGEGCYALLLDPQGRIEVDLAAYAAGERLLVFVPPGTAERVVDGWETFIQDVEIEVATDAFVVFGVHGPTATEKVASVLAGPGAPEDPHSFVRGSMGDVGVTVVRTDAPAGETGYEVVCTAAAATEVADTLVNRGHNAVPFGRTTWRSLTLEAGTPLFATELQGRIPNVVGTRGAVDFEKGCFVGQEVVSKVENRGQPSQRLVGLRLEAEGVPPSGAPVTVDDEPVGEVTRASVSPLLDAPIAFGTIDYGLEVTDATLEVDGDPATIEPLPFVEGSERSARIATYP